MEETEILEINFLKFEELKKNVALLKLRIVTNQKLLNRIMKD